MVNYIAVYVIYTGIFDDECFKKKVNNKLPKL